MNHITAINRHKSITNKLIIRKHNFVFCSNY